MSLYWAWIRVYDGVLWSPTKHQHHSWYPRSYQGPCSVIKPALSKLGHEQSTGGHCSRHMKEGWQCFRERWQRNHIWCCVHLLWLRFHGAGGGTQAHTNACDSPHSHSISTGWSQGALLKWANAIDPHFPEETEMSQRHRVKPKWLLPRVPLGCREEEL